MEEFFSALKPRNQAIIPDPVWHHCHLRSTSCGHVARQHCGIAGMVKEDFGASVLRGDVDGSSVGHRCRPLIILSYEIFNVTMKGLHITNGRIYFFAFPKRIFRRQFSILSAPSNFAPILASSSALLFAWQFAFPPATSSFFLCPWCAL